MDPRMAREGVEALVTQGREDVNPLFQAVRDQDTPVMTDRLREIMQRPDAQRVLGRVYRDLQNQGVDPVSVGFVRPGHGISAGSPQRPHLGPVQADHRA